MVVVLILLILDQNYNNVPTINMNENGFCMEITTCLYLQKEMIFLGSRNLIFVSVVVENSVMLIIWT